MRMRIIGVVLMLVLAVAVVAAVVLDRSLVRERETASSLHRSFASVDTTLAQFRGAQSAYLATGQSPHSWMSRATEFADHLQRELTRLRTDTQASAADVHYDGALSALAALRKLDERARDQFEGDQRFVASDLVFMDSPAEVDRFTSAARAAFTAEIDASRARFDQLVWARFGLLVVAVLAAGGVAWTFARVQADSAAPKPKPTTAEMLKSLPPAVKPATTPVAAPAAPPGPSQSLVLSDTAELCVDLARVADGADLPALVERTAKLLDAKGVVVWAVDASGGVLHPSVTHGYADKVVTRMGPLLVEADNVTSLAFRSKRPQCMSSTVPGTPGALAVPLITAAGCVGVLAAEVKPNRPISDLVPVAKIIAAQLAALVTPAAQSGHQGRQGREDVKTSRAAP